MHGEQAWREGSRHTGSVREGRRSQARAGCKSAPGSRSKGSLKAGAPDARAMGPLVRQRRRSLPGVSGRSSHRSDQGTVTTRPPSRGRARLPSGPDGRPGGRRRRLVRARQEDAGGEATFGKTDRLPFAPEGSVICRNGLDRLLRLGRFLFSGSRRTVLRFFLPLGRGDLPAKFAGVLPVEGLLDGGRHAAGLLRVVVDHSHPHDGLQHGPVAARNREKSERRAEEAEPAEHATKDRERLPPARLMCRGRGFHAARSESR